MEDEDSHYDASSDTHLSTAVVQDSDATAKAAESMVQQMQDILQEYRKKHAVVTVTDANPVALSTQKKYPRPYPINNENEEWMVYYDEFYRQEYYHEIHTNRTQWDPPVDRDASFSNSSSTEVFSVTHGNTGQDDLFLFDDRMESIMEQSESRVVAYRRRQRRKRRRRRAMLAVTTVLTFLLVSFGWYYLHCFHADAKHKPDSCVILEKHVKEHWQAMSHLVGSYSPLEASKQSKNGLLIEPAQCLLRFEDEVTFIAMRLAKQKEDSQPKVLTPRPWGCNIPFAYLFHARCRRLAHQNPVFDLHALINSMLQ
jgi:hypothetical protein